MNDKLEKATLAGGCFWCTEAIFKRLKGVTSVLPGYSGGFTKNPSYESVSQGNTGHAETIQIEFDPTQIPFEKILDVFWHTHNPTTKGRQGNDVGPQYRSIIFYHDENQKNVAQRSKEEFEKEGSYNDSVVTEIIPFSEFYVAEDYHKNYFENHKEDSYCEVVISPKIRRLLKKYGENVKEEYKNDM